MSGQTKTEEKIDQNITSDLNKAINSSGIPDEIITTYKVISGLTASAPQLNKTNRKI